MSQTKDEKGKRGNQAWHPERAMLAAFRDDKLDAADSARVRDHISECSPCRSEFLSLCR